MIKLLAIYIRELKYYFQSITAYVTITIFLFLSGYFFHSIFKYYNFLSYQAAKSQFYPENLNIIDSVMRPLLNNISVVLLLVLLGVGMAIGWAAQLLMGASRATVDWTLALVAGVLGSFVGGAIGSLLAGDGLALRPSGIIGSLVGAVIVVLVWQRVIVPRRSRR